MARRRKRDEKTIPIIVGNDPALWRYNNVQEALAAGSAVLVQLIREGERLSETQKGNEKCPALVEEGVAVRTA